MDPRLHYAVGDFLACLAVGALAGIASWAIVSPGWNMFAAMIPAMAVGMAIGLVLFFPAAVWLGAMEAMVPLMFNGMVAGMVVGMMAAMMPMSAGSATLHGMLAAAAGLAFIWTANAMLRGVTGEAKGG